MNAHALGMTATICALMTTMIPATAGAQTPGGPNTPISQTTPPGSPRVESAVSPEAGAVGIREWRWDGANEPLRAAPSAPVRPTAHAPRARQGQKHSGAYRGAQRVLAGVALGVVGFLAGATIGSVIEGHYVKGATIGAAGGATVGVLMVR